MYQNINKILYHGTISDIQTIDVTKGHGNKDFGKGFYMAVTKKQAIGMMHKKYKEAVRRSRNKSSSNFTERLYQLQIDTDYIKMLDIKYFETPNDEWLNFILMCRERGGVPHDYDLVIGPTADDDTMLCLKAYWDGLYGKPGTLDAKRILLKNLEPENLGIQYYIGKQDIANRIIVSMELIPWR